MASFHLFAVRVKLRSIRAELFKSVFRRYWLSPY